MYHLGLFQLYSFSTSFIQSKLISMMHLLLKNIILSLDHFRLLEFAQKRSNSSLARLMVICYWIQFILGILILWLVPHTEMLYSYWLATAHPISRIPVFLMGIFAGVMCNRIKNKDFDAFQSKLRIE